jgi:hypothetical protein
MNVKNFDELYPGRFLKAGLVTEKPTFTISDVYLDTLEGDEKTQKKGIVRFSDSEFELTLNKTNGTCLASMFGKSLDNWIGKRVTLCSEVTNFGRDKVDAVRVFGSPDIANDMNVTIQMPKRKPQVRVLKRTGTAPIQKTAQDLVLVLEHESLDDAYRAKVLEWIDKDENKGQYGRAIASVQKEIDKRAGI